MHRIVGLITRITEASRSAITLGALAEIAANALVDLFPRSSVIVFECDPREPLARIVSGANRSPAWRRSVINLSDVPVLAEALQHPHRVIVHTGQSARRAGLEGADGTDTFCGTIEATGGSRHALMLLAPPALHESAAREAAVEVTRRLLAAAGLNGGKGRAGTVAAIQRAKLEWKNSADTRPEIVGLLDARQRVLRVNRAIERWQLGTIGGAIGRDLHSLLHPSCSDRCCLLSGRLEIASRELTQASCASFEMLDPVLALELAVALNQLDSDRGTDGQGGRSTRIVFVVANAPPRRAAQREGQGKLSLEQRVAERTRELLATNRALRSEVQRRLEAEKSLQRSTRELEALSERLMTAQEAERKRISQDMHDSVGQMLSAIKYSLERAQVLSRREDPGAAAGVIEVTIRSVQNLMVEVRNISMNMRPALLDDLGAASAVRHLCRDWQDVYRGIDLQADIAVRDGEIPPILVTNVFRAVQESLNNVARHAAAHHVIVSIRIVAGVLEVVIHDDGQGFNTDEGGRPAIGTRGLRSLRDRAERTGGRCEVSSAPGAGTTVQLEWPVATGQAAQMENSSLN